MFKYYIKCQNPQQYKVNIYSSKRNHKKIYLKYIFIFNKRLTYLETSLELIFFLKEDEDADEEMVFLRFWCSCRKDLRCSLARISQRCCSPSCRYERAPCVKNLMHVIAALTWSWTHVHVMCVHYLSGWHHSNLKAFQDVREQSQYSPYIIIT